MGNQVTHSYFEQTNEYTKKSEIDILDKDKYLYEYTYYIEDDNETFKKMSNNAILDSGDFLNTLKNVSNEFIQKHCIIGRNELCENPIVLLSAYIVYCMRHLDDNNLNGSYAQFFVDYISSKEQKLMYLLKVVPNIRIIVDSKYYKNPRVLCLANDVNDYSNVINFHKEFGSVSDATIFGVTGIRLLSYP